MTAAKKSSPRKAAARKAPAKKAAPTQVEAQPAAEVQEAPTTEVGASLYPKGTPLYEYTAKSGAKIVFPKVTTRTQDRVFFWKLYNLEPVFQGFEWMREYEVPLEIQALAIALPDDEYEALFEGWFADADLKAGE